MMNSLDRYLNVIAGNDVDYLPRIPILMQYAAEHIGSNYGAFAANFKVLVESNIRCAQDFGFDQLSAISDPYRETHGFGARVEYLRDGVPKCINPPLENSTDLSKLRQPDPLKSERMLDRINAIGGYQQKFKDQYSIMGWIEGPAAEAATLRTAYHFLIDLLLNQSLAEELMDICVNVAIDFAGAQIEAGADTIGIGDSIASQVSPDVYEQLIQPREKKIIHAIKKMGAYVRLHICGNITHLLPGIANLGIDILDVDHLVDMVTVRKVVGDRVVLSGNIDPVQGVRFGTPESIRRTIQKIYQDVGNPYMVNAGCEIPSGTPGENLKALCDAIKPVN